MKKAVSILSMLVFLFLSLSVDAGNVRKITIEISKTGGKVIKEGKYQGEIGYERVYREAETKAGGSYFFKVDCRGKGDIPCLSEERAKGAIFSKCLYTELQDTIYATIERNIDGGITAGEFSFKGFLCKWGNGEKEMEEDENAEKKVAIYGYKLIITGKCKKYRREEK
jgi:hypothetical protein